MLKNKFNSKLHSIKKHNKSKSIQLNYGLVFEDPNFEKAYNDSLNDTRVFYLRYYVLSVYVMANILWFLNPHNLRVFEGMILISNIINNVLGLCALAFLFKKGKNFRHPQLGVFLLQIYVCIGYIETARNYRSYFTSSSFVMVTIMMENMFLIPLISCCNWKYLTVSLGFLSCYFHIRFLENENNSKMNWYPTVIVFGNFLSNSLGGYINEKYNREKFIQRCSIEESLRRYENIIKEVLPSGIIISREGEINFFNKGAKNLLKFTEKKELQSIIGDILIKEVEQSQEECIEKEAHMFSYKKAEDEPEQFKRSLAQLVESQPADFLFQRFKRFLGKRKKQIASNLFSYFEIQVAGIRWEGKKAQIIIITEDLVTQRLNLLQEEALYKDRLLATVSHDLRTPLNGIIGMLDLVMGSILDKVIRKSLRIALRSSKLLLFMINDILDLMQISNGELKLNPEVFNVEEIINDVVGLIKLQAKEKGVEIVYTNEINRIGSSSNFRSDPNRLRQIILNLLSNALKFTEAGRIIIKTENNYQGTQAIMFSVTDTGCGIRDEELPSLFKLFGKLQNPPGNKGNTTGIGLGLAISQILVKNLNQNAPNEEIKVISEYGKGSTFYFSLKPFVLKEECEIKNEKEPENFYFSISDSQINNIPFSNVRDHVNLNARTNEVNKKIQILIVDDDQINLMVLSTYVRAFSDCAFEIAVNGKEALNLVEERAKQGCFYHIIIMDCNMPVMDGFEASRAIVAMIKAGLIPPLKIIASTANSAIQYNKVCLDSGMSDFISKPYTKAQLREKIDKLMKMLYSRN